MIAAVSKQGLTAQQASLQLILAERGLDMDQIG
jgi:hypothetical protein